MPDTIDPSAVLPFLYSRRSVRRFTTRPVERDMLLDLLRAAMAAPSAVNRQPWAFVIVDDPRKMSDCVAVVPFARHAAPAAVVVCGDLSRALPAAARGIGSRTAPRRRRTCSWRPRG